MRDVHCHILPGVDDGACDLKESLAMLKAAEEAGITEIVCTPHVCDPYFDYDAMRNAYYLFMEHAQGISLHMGWEVNHTKLMELGMKWADRLCFDNGSELLLELSSHCMPHNFNEYDRTIFDLQARGFTVIIAHPERYQAIQNDIGIARHLVEMGCKLQASANFVKEGRFGRQKKTAKALFSEGLYAYIASDAHCADHYRYLNKARRILLHGFKR